MAEEIVDNPDRGGYAAANRDAIYQMITGSSPGDLREAVRALGGTRAVAQLAGRSQRTVQRWITSSGRQRISAPRADARQAISSALEQARSTPEGRARIAGGRRATLLRSTGAKMKGTATGGVVTPGGSRGYFKRRVFNHAVGSDVMNSAFDAYIEGGEEAAYMAFNEQFSADYGGDAGMFDEFWLTDMSGLAFTPDMGDR